MNPQHAHNHAIFWMLMTGFIAVSINTLARTLSHDFHPFQLVFFYDVLGLLFILPIVLIKKTSLKTRRLPLFGARAVLEFTAFSLGFFALAKLPFPTYIALSFTSPLFASVFAIFLLKEDNTIHRWIALLFGFVGVLVMTRPGDGAFRHEAFLVLCAASCFALCSISIKKLTRTEPPVRVAFYMLFLTSIVAAPFAAGVWRPVPVEIWPKLLLLGAMVASVQYTVSRAMSMGEMTAILPITYLNLLWSSLYAYFLFDEIISYAVIIGGALIIAAAFYTTKYGHRKTKISDVVQV